MGLFKSLDYLGCVVLGIKGTTKNVDGFLAYAFNPQNTNELQWTVGEIEPIFETGSIRLIPVFIMTTSLIGLSRFWNDLILFSNLNMWKFVQTKNAAWCESSL